MHTEYAEVVATARDILKAAARIRAGKLVAFPTETVYGLGADATSSTAVARVFRAKGRPSNNPLIVHVASAAQAKTVVREWPAAAQALARAFWPGPLTMVLPKAKGISRLATAGAESVGVRCPDHPVALALLRACKVPLVGPSANASGGVSPTRAEHVREEFDEETVMVLDGGACKVGIESTVVSLLDVVAGTGGPRVLRPGVISQEEIDKVLAKLARLERNKKPPATNTTRHAKTNARTQARTKARTAALLSPGLLSRHYAPSIPLVVLPTLQAITRELARAGSTKDTLVIAHVPQAALRAALREGDGFVRMPQDAKKYAAALYEALHNTLWFRRIVLLAPPAPAKGKDAGVWAAIGDRIQRASAKR